MTIPSLRRPEYSIRNLWNLPFRCLVYVGIAILFLRAVVRMFVKRRKCGCLSIQRRVQCPSDVRNVGRGRHLSTRREASDQHVAAATLIIALRRIQNSDPHCHKCSHFPLKQASAGGYVPLGVFKQVETLSSEKHDGYTDNSKRSSRPERGV
jgi:hypothetical protein